MAWRCLHGGLLTTVQDTGRAGWQQYGVVAAGALDAFALRVANILVGNEERAAGLEATLKGPTLQFTKDSLIAVGGGDLSPTIDGINVPMWRPVWVRAESVLRFGDCLTGCRAYLSIAGGIDTPEVSRSRSTHLRARLGGINGRALQAGDVLPCGEPSLTARRRINRLRANSEGVKFTAAQWSVSSEMLPGYQKHPSLRALRGEDFTRLTPPSAESFWRDSFRVTNESDRMGYRLSGNTLHLAERIELISEPTTWGAIQLPPDGQMIVLLADRQTVGGYPKIAHVASVDRPLIAQAKPGASVTFQEINLDAAQDLLCRRERQIEELKIAINLRD